MEHKVHPRVFYQQQKSTKKNLKKLLKKRKPKPQKGEDGNRHCLVVFSKNHFSGAKLADQKLPQGRRMYCIISSAELGLSTALQQSLEGSKQNPEKMGPITKGRLENTRVKFSGIACSSDKKNGFGNI